MKNTIKLFGIALAVVITFTAACTITPAVNSNPELAVFLPETFSPDPDVVDDKMIVQIRINLPDPVKEWTIRIQPVRLNTQRQEGEQRQARERTGDGQNQRQEGEPRQRQRRVFFEQTGTGTPPSWWEWDGKGISGRMAQSATDYQFSLTVIDVNDVERTFEGTFEMDIIVVREGENLRIVVPSIVFQPDSPNLSQEGDEVRSNRRVLNLIARALNKFEDYEITVEGYSNPLTPPGTPERTAEERADIPFTEGRAKSVADYLVENGNIDRQRLNIAGRGCANTVVDMDSEDFEEDNWQNRRVEFLLHKS